MRRLLLIFALLVPTAAVAFSLGGSSGGVSKSYVDAQVATIMSAMPQPANIAPMTDSTTAAIGSTPTRYMLQDAVRPARYRSATCTLSSGTCNLSWSTAFSATPNPIGDPSVINGNMSSSIIQCNFTAISTTGATVACKAVNLISLLLPINASNGLVVAGTAVQPL